MPRDDRATCSCTAPPLGWEHINLTGEYLWRGSAKVGADTFTPLRPLQPASHALFSLFCNAPLTRTTAGLPSESYNIRLSSPGHEFVRRKSDTSADVTKYHIFKIIYQRQVLTTAFFEINIL